MATGHRQIDLQHQELIEIINALEAANAAGRFDQAVGEVLPQLVAYTLFHFGTEETLMGPLGDHAAAHMAAHREFATRVKEMAERRLPPEDLPALIKYLNDWLVAHIMGTDRELAGQLAARDGNTSR